MDDFDDERFSRQALSSAPAARHVHRAAEPAGAAGEPRVVGNREEQLLGSESSPHALRVRGLDAEERGRIQQQVQLLAALEVAGVTAAPAVLELEDEGYVRETAPPPGHRSGRRAAESGTPPTGERRALSQARAALDALIDALHERGWVLGARHGGGLAARADGTALVLDLHGLRRDESLSARQDDRRWVDSVLQDQDRTLRRRVHLERPRIEEDALLVGDLPSPLESQHPAEQVPELVPGQAPPEAAMPQPALPVPRSRRRGAAGPLSRTATIEDPAQRHSAVTAQSGRGVPVLSSIHEVLRQPRLRRTAVLSGALVLLVGAVAALGAWWAQDRDATSTNPEGNRPVAEAPVEAGPLPAPSIEEPQMLVAQLAGSRHAYVTGLSDVPASAPGSVALDEDERVRDAYAGITVRDGGPVVHSAAVIEQPGTGSTAVLQAVTSMEELRLEEADGGTSAVPASVPVTIRIVLEWDGQLWRIVSATQVTGSDES